MIARTLLILAITLVSAHAQAPATPAFEVASVRASTDPEARTFFRVPPQGQITITHADLRSVIARAYEIDSRLVRYKLVGGNEAALSARYDITAQPPETAAPGQATAMLRTLLADRFRLHVHTEQREMPIYKLTLLQPDRFGPQLRRSTHDCASTTSRPPRDVCDAGIIRSTTGNNAAGPPAVVAQRVAYAGPFPRLVQDIQAFVDRPLADETRLEGNFEWRLTVATPGTFASDHPVIGVAVREQLGLALEEARGPVDVLVIDSVETPTPN